MYLLDTNICIYLIKHKPPEVMERFTKIDPGDIAISSITLSELEYGAYKSQQTERNLNALSLFTLSLEILAYDRQAASVYGQLRAQLEKKGMPIGPMDLLIAAHALSVQKTVVTNNEKEFKRVPGLKVENWSS